MPVGRAFTNGQARDIERALNSARQQTGLAFSVWVGDFSRLETQNAGSAGNPGTDTAQPPASTRERARRLHAALGREAANAVLIAVDPIGRWLEIVTGDTARDRLDDRTCAMVAMSMTSAFSIGDLLGGITNGLNMLSEHARRPPIAHQHDQV